jgi:DNA-binding NarL/FixJ family response regulator
MENLTVILADNQPFTNYGIRAILNDYFQDHLIFEDAKNKEELFSKLSAQKPNALIIDFDLFDFKEISELNGIHQLSPHTAVLVVTDNQSQEDIGKLLDCSINNIVLKSSEKQDLIDAFNAAIANRKFFCSEVLDILLQKKVSTRQIQEPGKLTQSETEVVRLIAQGLTTKEIAMQKHLSFHTIITHRKNIFRKLGISNSSELLMYAMRTGIVDSSEYYI